MSKHHTALLVIGPEPPPTTGMEVATPALLAELHRRSVPYFRVNTADPADELGHRGRWTIHNVGLAVKHLADALRKALRHDVGAVYIPIAQEFPALFRDLAFIALARLARKPLQSISTAALSAASMNRRADQFAGCCVPLLEAQR